MGTALNPGRAPDQLVQLSALALQDLPLFATPAEQTSTELIVSADSAEVGHRFR